MYGHKVSCVIIFGMQCSCVLIKAALKWHFGREHPQRDESYSLQKVEGGGKPVRKSDRIQRRKRRRRRRRGLLRWKMNCIRGKSFSPTSRTDGQGRARGEDKAIPRILASTHLEILPGNGVERSFPPPRGFFGILAVAASREAIISAKQGP